MLRSAFPVSNAPRTVDVCDLLARADSPRLYKCKDDVALWNGNIIAKLKLRPPLDDDDAIVRCRQECNKRDGLCTGVSRTARLVFSGSHDMG